MTITKQWLQKTISEMEAARDDIPFGLDEEGNNTLAALKMALKSLSAEPVGEVSVQPDGLVMDGMVHLGGSRTHRVVKGLNKMKRLPLGTKFYATPPAPVVDADDNFYSWFGREWHEHYQQNQYTTAAKQMLGVMAESAWKAGRAAMLNHSEHERDMVEPVSQPYKLREGVAALRNSGIEIDAVKVLAELETGNSPAIPDGWQLVPVEPTESMLDAAYSYPASTEDRMRKQYVAMLAAAPQQEIKYD